MAKRNQSGRRQAAAPEPNPSAEPVRTIWNQPLKADFKAFFKALGKAGAHGLAGKTEDLIADTTEAVTAIGITTPPEQLAWRLVDRGLKRAMVALIDEINDILLPLDISDDKAERIAGQIDGAMEVIPIQLNRDFFERPGEMPVVQRVQMTFTQWLLHVGLTTSKAEGLSVRLPRYFTFAVQEEWRKYRTTYQPILEFLDTPFAGASEREEQWNLYNAWLSRQADQRMFDETFSVRQVYVRPRAAFSKRQTTKHRHSLVDAVNHDDRKQQVVMLDDCLEQWLEKWDGSDPIRVLSGGPGSGKSAFARLFAAHASQRGKCRVIYVPLHLFELKADLIAAVHGFCEGHEHLPKGVLEAKNGEPKLLLIFDGLDELEKQGRMTAQVASEFVAEVSRAVDRLNQVTPRVMILLCGRPVSVQASETVLRREEQFLHLLPYITTDKEMKQYEDPLKLLLEDQRDIWWRKYGECVGRDYSRLPEALRRDEFLDITAQPLLNYLVALSFDRGKLDFTTDINLNGIYNDLIDAVYERGYEKRPIRSVQGLSVDKFVRVLEEIGLAAWHGDGRTTTVKKIEVRCGKSPLVLHSLTQFAGDAEAGVTRLLTAFYFRQHGDVEGEKTFEFTHKSFGEYLTSRRVIRELRLIHEKISSRDNGDEGGFDEQQSLGRWVDLCGPSEITHELQRFLKQEAATYGLDIVKSWQTTCVRLINHLLRHGMPMEKLSPLPTFRELDRQARNAEESLLALLNACAERTRTTSEINWPEPTSFGAWLARLSPQREGPLNRAAYTSLSLMDISKQHIDIHDFYKANLTRVEARHLLARFTSLMFANLREANLGEANLRGANLSEANLRGAIHTGAELEGALVMNTAVAGMRETPNSGHIPGGPTPAGPINGGPNSREP